MGSKQSFFYSPTNNNNHAKQILHDHAGPVGSLCLATPQAAAAYGKGASKADLDELKAELKSKDDQIAEAKKAADNALEKVKGFTPPSGAAGVGITNVTLTGKDLVITLSDGSIKTISDFTTTCGAFSILSLTGTTLKVKVGSEEKDVNLAPLVAAYAKKTNTIGKITVDAEGKLTVAAANDGDAAAVENPDNIKTKLEEKAKASEAIKTIEAGTNVGTFKITPCVGAAQDNQDIGAARADEAIKDIGPATNTGGTYKVTKCDGSISDNKEIKAKP